ncbi:hypothetical protein AALO_G00304480 [Alosa alosa]|uniref:Aconitase A/isopropylmalate dehydratase small subunit swivel domain-containing protein n=1 Tax=Alosa alosa TaxID=278164 RepID=A0AAV6FF61_9TELE|nr:hypothetical protein AALO_G00304480 [Alosa alosa]
MEPMPASSPSQQVLGNKPKTLYQPTGETMDVFDAAERYQKDGYPLLVLAGKEYGSGSSRDWAAKGPFLLLTPRMLVDIKLDTGKSFQARMRFDTDVELTYYHHGGILNYMIRKMATE